MRLLAYWRGPAAVVLNAGWATEAAPVEQVGGGAGLGEGLGHGEWGAWGGQRACWRAMPPVSHCFHHARAGLCPPPQVAFVKSCEAVYCFQPLMVKVLFIGQVRAGPWRGRRRRRAAGRRASRPSHALIHSLHLTSTEPAGYEAGIPIRAAGAGIVRTQPHARGTRRDRLPARPARLTGAQEGAVFKNVTGGSPASQPWSIFGKEGNRFSPIGRMQARSRGRGPVLGGRRSGGARGAAAAPRACWATACDPCTSTTACPPLHPAPPPPPPAPAQHRPTNDDLEAVFYNAVGAAQRG